MPDVSALDTSMSARASSALSTSAWPCTTARNSGVAPKSFTVPFTAPDCCAMCGRAGAKMRCARCQRVRYCSGPCQVQHWKKGGHRKECGKQQGAAALADAPPSLEVASEAEIAAYDLPD